MPTANRSPIAGTLTALALVFLFFPLAIVVLFSFNTTAGLSFPFHGFSLRWYDQTFSSPEFRQAATNSLYVASVVAGTTLLLGTLAAYGLSRSASRLRTPLAVLFFVPLTVPGLFLGISLLVAFSGTHIETSLTTVIIAHLVFVFPYFLLIAKAALDRMDPALEESAADLGASPWQVFRRVTLAQVWPVLLGATSLAFILSFDEFIITFFVIGPSSTVPLFIWSSMRRTLEPSVNAVATLLMVVTVLLFIITFLVTLYTGRRRSRVVDEALLGEET